MSRQLDLDHPALRSSSGVLVEGATLSDQERVALLLQGAALLAHLHCVGWRLVKPWHRARVDSKGVLVMPYAELGDPIRPVQESLRELVRVLFSSVRVAGRGEARRCVRGLLEDWSHDLPSLTADVAVAQILERAPFLWRPAFAASRRSLAAIHRLPDGVSRIWFVGPGQSRQRLTAALGGFSLEALVASDRCRQLWTGAVDRSPLELAQKGRYQEAVLAWSAVPPADDRERLIYLECLFALGRFEAVLAATRRSRDTASRILRVESLYQLHRYRAAQQSIKRLVDTGLSPQDTVELAATAARVLTNLGDLKALRSWRRRLEEIDDPLLAGKAAVEVAWIWWDLEDLLAMEEWLARAESLDKEVAASWKFRHAKARLAMDTGRLDEAERELGLSVSVDRRRLKRHEAGRLWSEIGCGRVAADNLPGAERAYANCWRLLRQCDGPAKFTLALTNLAEVRIRRGRLRGVEEALITASRANQEAGNTRGAAYDVELWARFYLARGDSERALEHCRSEMQRQHSRGETWNLDNLRLLAARALGWLERPEEAAALLLERDGEGVAQLDVEERPAVWALAGDDRRAIGALPGDEVLRRLWLAALNGEPLHPLDLRAVSELEPFRGGRLVFDLALLGAKPIPGELKQRAAHALEAAGALPLARQLRGLEHGPWVALRHFLELEQPTPQAVADMLRAAGIGEASVEWCSAATNEIESWVPGPRGGDEIRLPCAGGELRLRASRLDSLVESLARAVALKMNRQTIAPVGSGGQKGPKSRVLGKSAAIKRVLARIEKLAPQEIPVLIQGRTGTGKEVVAQEIHRLSRRSKGPWLPVNCATMTDSNLLLSDLFGHARGSFTGAAQDRRGIFEEALGGTVFLDEVGELPAVAQGMLLRVLQEGEVRRLGESRLRKVDVRVVAATNRDLRQMIRDGTFREDLFYRLHVASVELPSLADRGNDVLLLAAHILSRLEGKPQLTAAAKERLLRDPWPGNIRQLENVLLQAAALAFDPSSDSPLIDVVHLEMPVQKRGARSHYHELVEEYRRSLLQEALAANDGKQADAARQLGLTRQALSYLVRKLGLRDIPKDRS